MAKSWYKQNKVCMEKGVAHTMLKTTPSGT